MPPAEPHNEGHADRPPAAPLVEVLALHKRFGPLEVLKGIDLTVAPGEVIAMIGKSGSGKSTLLRCINGLETFESGQLTVDGQALLHHDARAMRALRQRVGMVFQSFNLFPHLTVGRNVMLAPMRVKGLTEAAAEALARRLLARVGLAEKFDAHAEQLSGVSSSAWPLRARWRWSRRCCCATRSHLRSTPSWLAKCCGWSRRWPTTA
jgi:polar amino acid transport system ATP-binding protein